MTFNESQLSPEQAMQQIRQIRETMARASRTFFMSAWQWIEWGVLIALGGIGTLYLLKHKLSEHIPFIWIALFILGGALETIIWYRGAQERGINPLQPFYLKIWGVMLGLFVLAFFYTLIFVQIGLPLYIPGLWLLIIGICILILVFLGDRKDLIPIGTLELISGILASSVLLDYSIHVGIVAFGFGSIVMGIYQLYMDKKHRSKS